MERNNHGIGIERRHHQAYLMREDACIMYVQNLLQCGGKTHMHVLKKCKVILHGCSFFFSVIAYTFKCKEGPVLMKL